jgi:hypothetical protein
LTTVPSPTTPEAFNPQQYPEPEVVTPHVVADPTATDRQEWVPDTRTGTSRIDKLPSPICPLEFWPQQYPSRAEVTAHDVPPPKPLTIRALALMPVNSAEVETRVGTDLSARQA